MIHVEPYTGIKSLVLSSRTFDDNGEIPRKYTCDGLNVNPPIDISFIPQQTKSLAVIMEDPDAPISSWTHWLLWNLPVTHQIRENTFLGKNGINDFSRHFYCGPCPMTGTHHYIFKVYALNCLLNLPVNTRKPDLEKAMAGNVLAFGELTGVYARK